VCELGSVRESLRERIACQGKRNLPPWQDVCRRGLNQASLGITVRLWLNCWRRGNHNGQANTSVIGGGRIRSAPGKGLLGRTASLGEKLFTGGSLRARKTGGRSKNREACQETSGGGGVVQRGGWGGRGGRGGG